MTTAPGLTVLHLSDLHFGKKNRFQGYDFAAFGKEFSQAVQSACKELKWERSVDLVIVSGDLAELGKPGEFREARTFLRAVMEGLSLLPEHAIFVPGNHDLSWPLCKQVDADREIEWFDDREYTKRLNAVKFRFYQEFLKEFYGLPDSDLDRLPDRLLLDEASGAYLHNFLIEGLPVSVAALNTSERETHKAHGGELGKTQGRALLDTWMSDAYTPSLKILVVHHNPLPTPTENLHWTKEWLNSQMALGTFEASAEWLSHYTADMAGFEGTDLLKRIVHDTNAHLVLHGHHHNPTSPEVWLCQTGAIAPILSVGSFGLESEQLPTNQPLTCQLLSFQAVPEAILEAIPLEFDPNYRPSGTADKGQFRLNEKAAARYKHSFELPDAWATIYPSRRTRMAITPVEATSEPLPTDKNLIPTAPAFYAEPPYIGSNDFVGRQAELDRLNDWATSADSHPILLFEAIGGTGKSMLTWEWTRKHANVVRNDWAGCFWYSFYEKGAILTDFCQRALAYVTGKPLEAFQKRKTADLSAELLPHLQERPWLFILDGLERILVAYHRYDAAQITDDAVDNAQDQIAHRDPCAAIRSEDDEVLRMLAAAAPSKILITSRLTPRILLNSTGQGIQGVLRESLRGLLPADAEQLLRSCGISGNSQAIQNFLKSHCDCHPLVTGIVAGLIFDYLPNRNNFDAWLADAAAGGQFNVGTLDLVQKRNHILRTAINALSKESLQLLSTLALLSQAVDFPMLSAFNPHLSPELEEGSQQKLSSLMQELTKTVRDLERRGLLQYDFQSKRYDLHPVVRSVAAGGLQQEEKERYGQRVIDYFSQQSHNPYEDANSLEDLQSGLNVLNTLLRMGHRQQFCDAYIGIFSSALLFNLEAYAESLALLHPFFPHGWEILPTGVSEEDARLLGQNASIVLSYIGAVQSSMESASAVLIHDLRKENWSDVALSLRALAIDCLFMLHPALCERLLLFAREIANLLQDKYPFAATQQALFVFNIRLGRYSEAEAIRKSMRDSELWLHLPRNLQSNFERWYVELRFRRGTLAEEELISVEHFVQENRSRIDLRNTYDLHGRWQIQRSQWSLAVESLQEAIRMAREIQIPVFGSEARLCLARFHLRQLPDPGEVANRLSQSEKPPHLPLAQLWLAIGDQEEARKHALIAYRIAWEDGEPYVDYYSLNEARTLLNQVGEAIPVLPPYNPAKDERFPWEADVIAAIERLRAEANEKSDEAET